MTKERWKAKIVINVPVKGKIEEIEEIFLFDEYVELGDYIEQGPDWNLIVRVTVVHNT